MPGSKFTKKANTPARNRQWQDVYDSAVSHGRPKGEAIREANSVLKKHPTKKKK